ncbi:secreted RxLR effector protein 161-like [Nicotiana sylvestris]|uniref:secreted RxLR effector protein 161-like n=1 Tax=Nicotiana sylvestris TaxID=4096 RepID=UPI00388CDA8F
MGANIVEDNKKRKKASDPKYNLSKKRFSENCYNCGKIGHKSTECRARKKDKKRGQANMVEKTPIDVNLALTKNKGQSITQLDYTRPLGCLMYIMNCTRPDIACAISKLSRYMSNPDQSHWMAMKRVLGYLEHTQNFDLHYSKFPAVIEGYRDANWITSSVDSKSTSGYVFIVGG